MFVFEKTCKTLGEGSSIGQFATLDKWGLSGELIAKELSYEVGSVTMVVLESNL